MAAVINSPTQYIRVEMQQDTTKEEFTAFKGNHMTEELKRAWENAYSFNDKNRPRDMRYIGTVVKEFAQGEREFLFYQDLNKQYWYESRWKYEKK